MTCPRYNQQCNEFMCGSSVGGICTEGQPTSASVKVILEVDTILYDNEGSKWYKFKNIDILLPEKVVECLEVYNE